MDCQLVGDNQLDLQASTMVESMLQHTGSSRPPAIAEVTLQLLEVA
jgi:hypothetical protein